MPLLNGFFTWGRKRRSNSVPHIYHIVRSLTPKLSIPPHHLPHFAQSFGSLAKALRLPAKSLAHQLKTLGSEPNRLAPEPKILTF